jgi:uncharacterized iron-regulated membrane protein
MSVSQRVGIQQAKREARQKRHSQRKLWRMHGARNVFGLLMWGLVLATFVGMTIRHLRDPDPVASFKRQIENPEQEAARLKAEQELLTAQRGASNSR